MKPFQYANRNSKQGFTLFELLLVIMLMAIIVSTVKLPSITTSINEEIETEARRLGVLIDLASEYAVLNNAILGISFIKQHSYKFLIFDGERWQEINQPPLETRELPEYLNLTLNLDGLAWSEEDMLKTIEWKKEDDDDFSLETDEEEQELNIPQVYILSSGEISAFDVVFDAEDADIDEDVKRMHVQGKFATPVIVKREDELDDW